MILVCFIILKLHFNYTSLYNCHFIYGNESRTHFQYKISFAYFFVSYKFQGPRPNINNVEWGERTKDATLHEKFILWIGYLSAFCVLKYFTEKNKNLYLNTFIFLFWLIFSKLIFFSSVWKYTIYSAHLNSFFPFLATSYFYPLKWLW